MHDRGTTLLELLVVMSLVAVLGVLGAPRLMALMDALRLETGMQTILTGLRVARLGAIHRRSGVSLCAAGEITPCGRDWRQGVIVFVDRDLDGRLNGADAPIWRSPTLSGLGQAQLRIFGGRPVVRFRPDGRTRSGGGSFILCDRSGTRLARIVLNAVGRVRVERFGPGERDPDQATDSRGRVYRCLSSG